MKSFVAAAMAGFAAATPMSAMDYKFIEYVAHWGKSYATVEEYNARQAIFAAKDVEMLAENASQNSYVLAHNRMSDWTEAEYKAILGYKKAYDTVDRYDDAVVNQTVPSFTAGWNWVDQPNIVNPVKDQGQCGSCWAFSAASCMESAWAIAHGQLYSFAEQQLVDCVKTCMGCNGGWQSRAFNYYETHHPMAESSYTYTAQDGTCAYNSGNSYTSINSVSWTNVTPQDIAALQTAVYQQTVSVSIEADKMCFQLYKSGVLNNTKCGTSLDHAVVTVGYGNESGQDYWLVRNSWGSSWGENGYIKIAAVAGDGICGIQMGPLYPTVN